MLTTMPIFATRTSNAGENMTPSRSSWPRRAGTISGDMSWLTTLLSWRSLCGTRSPKTLVLRGFLLRGYSKFGKLPKNYWLALRLPIRPGLRRQAATPYGMLSHVYRLTGPFYTDTASATLGFLATLIATVIACVRERVRTYRYLLTNAEYPRLYRTTVGMNPRPHNTNRAR